MRTVRTAYAIAATTIAAITILAAGCSSSHPSAAITTPAASTPEASTATTGTPGPALPGTSGTTSTSSPAAASATPGSSAPAVSSPIPQSQSQSSAAKCLSSLSVIYPAGDNHVRSACVHQAATVTATLLPVEGHAWTTPSSSDPAVATVTDHADPDGTHHLTVTGLHPGTATLTSTAASVSDMSRTNTTAPWTLTLTVVP